MFNCCQPGVAACDLSEHHWCGPHILPYIQRGTGVIWLKEPHHPSSSVPLGKGCSSSNCAKFSPGIRQRWGIPYSSSSEACGPAGWGKHCCVHRIAAELTPRS